MGGAGNNIVRPWLAEWRVVRYVSWP